MANWRNMLNELLAYDGTMLLDDSVFVERLHDMCVKDEYTPGVGVVAELKGIYVRVFG